MAPKDESDAAIAALAPLEAGTLDAGDGSEGYEPVGQAVTRRLREAIIDGRLRPGARVRQEVVARHLGTSRIPVREALRSLETEGLVVLVPHSGARVAQLDFSELTELYRIREAIEPLAIAESAPRLTDAQLDELRELVEQIEQAADEPVRWLEHDRLFHLKSYAAAPLPRVLEMIERFWNTTQHYRRAYNSTLDPHDIEIVQLEHRVILDALERRDGTDAETRQRSHIRRTRLTLTEHREVFDT
jgi:DNA-binding GntR family transcriptional regulator